METLEHVTSRYWMRLYNSIYDLTNPHQTIKQTKLSKSDDLFPKSFTNESLADTCFHATASK